MEKVIFESYLYKTLTNIENKKYHLLVRVLKYLYFKGPKPVAEICRHLKISSPNGNAILGELISHELIEKKGYGPSKGGRKPELYGLKADAFNIVAVDMNIQETRIAIFNSNNKQISETKSFSLKMDNEPGTLDKLAHEVHQMISSSNVDRTKILGVGISMPGLVDSQNGFNYSYFNFGEKPSRQIIQEKLKFPVFIENDAKAVTLAAWQFGAAKNQDNVLVLLLDWGIGLGMILNGKLYRGANGFAGEFSHIPMLENGESCICGKNGCLETIASGVTLVEKAKEGILNGKSSLMSHYAKKDINKVNMNTVVDAALQGDQFAINLLAEVGENLGKAISILIQLYNPGMIILGGKMAESGQFITIPIQQAINTYSMHKISEGITIKNSEMGKEIGLKGAMSVVMEDIFDMMSTFNIKKKTKISIQHEA